MVSGKEREGEGRRGKEREGEGCVGWRTVRWLGIWKGKYNIKEQCLSTSIYLLISSKTGYANNVHSNKRYSKLLLVLSRVTITTSLLRRSSGVYAMNSSPLVNRNRTTRSNLRLVQATVNAVHPVPP